MITPLRGSPTVEDSEFSLSQRTVPGLRQMLTRFLASRRKLTRSKAFRRRPTRFLAFRQKLTRFLASRWKLIRTHLALLARHSTVRWPPFFRPYIIYYAALTKYASALLSNLRVSVSGYPLAAERMSSLLVPTSPQASMDEAFQSCRQTDRLKVWYPKQKRFVLQRDQTQEEETVCGVYVLATLAYNMTRFPVPAKLYPPV